MCVVAVHAIQCQIDACFWSISFVSYPSIACFSGRTLSTSITSKVLKGSKAKRKIMKHPSWSLSCALAHERNSVSVSFIACPGVLRNPRLLLAAAYPLVIRRTIQIFNDFQTWVKSCQIFSSWPLDLVWGMFNPGWSHDDLSGRPRLSLNLLRVQMRWLENSCSIRQAIP